MPFPSPSSLLSTIQGGSTAPLLSSTSNVAKTTLPSPDQVLTASRAGSSQPSFASNLITAGVGLAKRVGGAIGNFFSTNAQNVSDVATGKLSVSPSDVLEGVKQTGAGITSLAQGFNEGVARIAKSSLLATVGPDLTAKIASSPVGDFAKVATGRQNAIDVAGLPQPKEAGQPLITYQDVYQKAHSYALNQNASIPQANTFAGLTVIGMMLADNPAFGPEGSGAEGAFKLSAKGIEDVAKASTDDVVKAIIKAENPKIGDKALEMMTPVFREAKTPDEVKTAVDQIANIQKADVVGQATKPASKDLPKPEDVLQSSKDNLAPEAKVATEDVAKQLEEPTPSYFRALPDEGTQGVKFVPVEGQPVKIAEGLDTFIHQPENGAYEVLEGSTGRIIGKPAATAVEAIQSAKDAIGTTPIDQIQAKIAEHTKVPLREAAGAVPGSPQAQRLAERGIAPVGAPKPFDQGLIRDISQETMGGPVLDRIRPEFPNISDHALAPIAARLAQLNRSGDIEGMLQVIRNVNNDIGRARAAGKGPIRISKETLDQSIAKVGSREPVGDLPASVGELLTSAERGRYLDNIQRAIKDPEQAVLAQQEYEALWEHADQRILDRYEELKIQRDIMRDMIDSHPGKEISSLYKGTFLSPDDVGLDELLAQRPKLGIDSRISEIMMGQTQPGVADTIAQGQKALDDWRGMREDLKQIEADLREIRPKARAARILQSMVEDVPVIARQKAGEIESLANFDDVRKYKDITGFMGQARDIYRNFERVFGDRFPDVKRVILDPFDRSKGAMVDELSAIEKDLRENVVDKLGIKKGSKLSAAVQRYGDTSLSEGERWGHDRLMAELGSKDTEKVIKADAFFRDRYNKFIDRVNEVRKEIYPNDPTKLVMKRKDYYRHFQELGDGFRSIVDLFESPAGIDPRLAGLSEWTLPKTKFLPFAQERLGKDSTIDAVGGFLNYAPSYAYAVHIDPHIGNFRYLRRRLSEVSPTPGVRELVPAADKEAAAMGAQDLVKQPGINNFLTFLDDYANDLAGKTNPMDRYIQKVIPGGRKTMRVIDWINSRTKANTILGNLSSAVAQIFNVPNGIASAKLYSVPGLQRALASIFVHDDAMAASSFLKERYMGSIANKFNVDWIEHPIRGTSERGKELAAWITGALDEVGTKFIWQSHYAKGLAEGAEDPIKYADDITRQMVAGRGIGEVPLLQKSKIFQIVAPFQVEVANAWYVLGGFMRRKDFGAVATLVAANYLFNRAAEQIRGTPVVWDPVNDLISGTTDAINDYNDEHNAGRSALIVSARMAGDLLSNIPLGQTVASALSDDFVKKTLGFQGGKQELFGSSDPGRFGSGLISINGISDPLTRLLPPFGGVQAKRTIEGIQSMLQGQVTDSTGKLSFATNPTVKNVIQAVLFGKNATAEAQDFYNTRSDLFQRVYREQENRTQTQLDAESKWNEIKTLPKDQKIAALQKLDGDDPTLADAVYNVAQQEAQGLTGTERLIGMLGVNDGERAKYIADTVGGMGTRAQQIEYLQELDNKKLISNTVFDQLTVLLKGKIKEK